MKVAAKQRHLSPELWAPIVDRNVYSLLDLTPGVQSNNNAPALVR